MHVINIKKLEELYGSKNAAYDIINMFKEQSGELMTSLSDAVKHQDQDALYSLCHKAIGQCRYIAAEPLEKELTILQNQQGDPSQNLNNIQKMINQIHNDFT